MIASHNEEVLGQRTLRQRIVKKRRGLENHLTNTRGTSIKVKRELSPSSTILPRRLLSTKVVHPKAAGLNPLVDEAAYLFTILGKLKQLAYHPSLQQLQTEILVEIDHFLKTSVCRGYSPEAMMICRYMLAATFDDVITTTIWGQEGKWEGYRLLPACHRHLPTEHLNKQPEQLLVVMERATAEPSLYIDLMEFVYLCLSLGYKSNESIESLSHRLYKHIRAYRGHVSKALTLPLPVTRRKKQSHFRVSHALSLTLTTFSLMMFIFVGFGFISNSISNHLYEEVVQFNVPTRF